MTLEIEVAGIHCVIPCTYTESHSLFLCHNPVTLKQNLQND